MTGRYDASRNIEAQRPADRKRVPTAQRFNIEGVAAPAQPEYSLVVPVYNEEDTIAELVRRLSGLLDGLDGRGEVFLVDDGSSDASYERMSAARAADPRFKLLRLSRNFGHQIAVTAGL